MNTKHLTHPINMDESLVAQLCGGKNKKIGGIDINCDITMVMNGLRPAHPSVDYTEFSKVLLEKVALKNAKRGAKTLKTMSFSPINDRGVKAKLTIFIKNVEKSNTFKTTYSFMVLDCEVLSTIEKVSSMMYNSGELYKVTKVVYNGVEEQL